MDALGALSGICWGAGRAAFRRMIGSTKIKMTAKAVASNKPRTGAERISTVDWMSRMSVI
jgi:hypothetical protein